jgi:hypothetical protein
VPAVAEGEVPVGVVAADVEPLRVGEDGLVVVGRPGIVVPPITTSLTTSRRQAMTDEL